MKSQAFAQRNSCLHKNVQTGISKSYLFSGSAQRCQRTPSFIIGCFIGLDGDSHLRILSGISLLRRRCHSRRGCCIRFGCCVRFGCCIGRFRHIGCGCRTGYSCRIGRGCRIRTGCCNCPFRRTVRCLFGIISAAGNNSQRNSKQNHKRQNLFHEDLLLFFQISFYFLYYNTERVSCQV